MDGIGLTPDRWDFIQLAVLVVVFAVGVFVAARA